MTQHKDLPSKGESSWLIGLAKNLRLAWRLLRDPLVPAWTKLIPLGALVYILLPADLLPDLIIGLGQMDDIAVFLLSLKLFISLCPLEVVQRHLAEMSSIKVSYRVAKDEPQATDVAGYLDVEHRMLPDAESPRSAEQMEKGSD